jgi:F-type H+-transporting ATPase subunit delta
MQGASRDALAALREVLGGLPVHATLGDELLSVAALLGRESGLRAALTDTGTAPERRAALATRVLQGKVAAPTLAVVEQAARQRWSSPRDLVEGVETVGAEAMFAFAESDGRIDAVEDELFRFTRVLDASGELQVLLTNPAVADDAKAEVVSDLLAQRAQPETVALVRHAVAHPGGRRAIDTLGSLVQLAATRREQLLADVRAPVPLTPEQQQRLAAALTRIYGRQVTLAVSVEPELLGGAVVRVGDEIIDGSVASKLASARRTLTQ